VEEATLFEDLHRHAEKLQARIHESQEKLGKLAGEGAGKAYRKLDRRSVDCSKQASKQAMSKMSWSTFWRLN